jgi:hypothetical protein
VLASDPVAERTDGLFDAPAISLPGRDAYSEIKGFLTPAMVGVDPNGRTVNAFERIEDFDKVRKGYACGNCCAEFRRFMLECPVCHQPTDVHGQWVRTPEEWQAYVDQRHAPIGTAGPDGRPLGELPLQARSSRSPDEFFRAVGQTQETVRLSQLKPTKWGRGRPK